MPPASSGRLKSFQVQASSLSPLPANRKRARLVISAVTAKPASANSGVSVRRPFDGHRLVCPATRIAMSFRKN
jgi:hypothetical protein